MKHCVIITAWLSIIMIARPGMVAGDSIDDIDAVADLANTWLACGIPDGQPGVVVPGAMAVHLFDLSDVRLLAGPFKKAQDYNKAYLLSLDPDRLMYLMRQGAGLTPKASDHYGGWDNWGSTAAGAYLSACSLMYAATGDEQLRQRADYIVSEMVQCQQAWGDGGLYVNAAEANWFAQLRAGNMQTSHVVPWYQTHKILAGLRDAWLFAHNQQARQALIRMADWTIDVTTNLSASQWQAMLACEHGGPHEVLADVYAVTGQSKYLEIAEKFRHNAVFDPMRKGALSSLYGLHGNTQIPKFVGYERIAELGGGDDWHAAAVHFYDLTTRYLSWVNGANTQWESFFPRDDFPVKVDDNCGPETCNTYNMLKLTRLLYADAPRVSLVDYYENALYNHILPSIDPDQGGYVYYTSMKPGHYRVFSTDTNSFWCCVVTGIKNPGRYGDMIYAHDDNGLYVNLFIPSELTWPEKRLTLRQETAFPDESTSRLTLQINQPRKMDINIRCPQWVADGSLVIHVNGQRQTVSATPGTYVTLHRLWRTGDCITIDLPLQIRTVPLPGSSDYRAVMYGPVLLAGALGPCDLSPRDFVGGGLNDQAATQNGLWSDVPVLVGDVDDIPSKIVRRAGDDLTFRTVDLGRPQEPVLKPFYNVHRQRYVLYWPVVDESGYPALREAMDNQDRQTMQLRQNIDNIQMGIGTRSEDRHHLAGDRMDRGGLPGARWRSAKNGGWFSYEVTVLPTAPVTLVCRYRGSDGGARTFDILVNNQLIATQQLTAAEPNKYIYAYYPIPAGLTAGKNKVTIKFDAAPHNTAGGLYELWTISDP